VNTLGGHFVVAESGPTGEAGGMLHGARVVLRPMERADLGALTALFQVPEVVEAWPGDNAARLRAMLEGGEGEPVGCIVEHEDRLIGFVQYYEELDPNYRFAGIDIVLHPDWCNKGLGTDAVRTLARYLFEQRGHHRLMIDPRVTNVRAIASYRKVGFRDVGVMRQYELDNDGRYHDSLLMDLLRDELT
jgi:aminoglycoside 6'-N-acetyltransferase